MIRLLIPTAQTENHNAALWEHTCFEAFIAIPGSSAYQEFNFSPSGQSATYTFSGYRQPDGHCVRAKMPQISIELSVGRLNLIAVVNQELLLPGMATSKLQIGLSAVIESTDIPDSNHSYWALRHPAARPDFHHRESFALELAAQ